MKANTNKQVGSEFLFLIPAIFLLGFSVYKAWHISFTIDESTSYLFYVRDSYTNIINYTRLEANNHVLNSVLMKFFCSWLPLSELTLRLPNILAHGLYLWATWKLISDFKNIWFRLGIYLFLNLNPYLLDFFSLARGYALSWAFMVLSIYFLKIYIVSKIRKFLYTVLCFVSAALGVLASFTLLDFYLALLIVYFIYDFYFIKSTLNNPWQIRSFFFRMMSVTLISSLLFYYVLHISYLLLQAHFLYFGGDVSFWHDTVHSLIISWMYNASYAETGTIVIRVFACLIITVVIIAILYQFLKSRETRWGDPFFYVLAAIFILVILGIIMQHDIVGTRFVIQRTAGYILVLFLLVTANLLNEIIRPGFRLAAAIILGAIASVHFALTFNKTSVYEWRFDSQTKKMMQDLGSDYYQHPAPESFIFFHPYKLNATTCMFYQELFKYHWMLPLDYTDVITHAEDYYYLPDDQLNVLNGHKFKVIGHYPEVHETLVRNLEKSNGISYGHRQLDLFDTVSQNSLMQKTFTLLNIENEQCIRVDTGQYCPYISLNGSIFRQRADVNVMASAKVYFPDIKNGVLVIALYNKAGKILRWDSMDFSTYLLKEKGWMNIPFKVKTDKIYPDADNIRFGIWNTGKKPILASKIRADIFVYSY